MKKKLYKKGKYTLEYERYQDNYGFIRNAFDITWCEDDGKKYHMPVMEPYVVRDTPLFGIDHEFTDKECEKLLTDSTD